MSILGIKKNNESHFAVTNRIYLKENIFRRKQMNAKSGDQYFLMGDTPPGLGVKERRTEMFRVVPGRPLPNSEVHGGGMSKIQTTQRLQQKISNMMGAS